MSVTVVGTEYQGTDSNLIHNDVNQEELHPLQRKTLDLHQSNGSQNLALSGRELIKRPNRG